MSHNHDSSNINYMHILLVAPFLGHAGFKMKEVADGKEVDLNHLRTIGLVLILVSLIIILYHSYLVSQKIKSAKSDEIAKNVDAPQNVKV